MMTPLYELLPRVADAQTRSVVVFAEGELPPDTYTFVESFCDDEVCDCRHAFIVVVSERRRRPVATLGYGWEDRAYYLKWFGREGYSVDFMHGLCVAPMSIQTELSRPLLRLYSRILEADAAYRERIVRHYRIFREAVDRRRRQPRGSTSGRRKGKIRNG